MHSSILFVALGLLLGVEAKVTKEWKMLHKALSPEMYASGEVMHMIMSQKEACGCYHVKKSLIKIVGALGKACTSR
jgi:hypothetical protein